MLLKLQTRAGNYKRLLKRVKHLLNHSAGHQIKMDEKEFGRTCEELPKKKRLEEEIKV